jgi:hypothetical protein
MTDYIKIDITELVEPPSIEEEFTMERRIQELDECDDKDELKRYAAALLRQNLHQSHFVSRCLDQIALLQAKLVCAENPVKQPEPNWIQNLFYGK